MSAQDLVKHFMDLCAGRDVVPPQRVVGQVARLCKELLDEGQNEQVVGLALGKLVQHGLHPSALPSLVLETGLRMSVSRQEKPREPEPIADPENAAKARELLENLNAGMKRP